MKKHVCLALALGLLGALSLTGCNDKSAAGPPPPIATGTGATGGKLEVPKAGTVSGDPAKKGAGSDKDKSTAAPPPMATGGAPGGAAPPPAPKPAGSK